VERVRRAGLLAYPTETVWGLGADAGSERAVEALRAWKGRCEGTPLPLLVETPEDLEALGIEVPALARRLAGRFWPGPLTLVLPARRRFAVGVARADGAVGVRCSSHPLAAALARRLRGAGVGPITATSLNRSGEPPARTRREAEALVGEGPGEPRLLEVEGAEAGGDRESTVVDATGKDLRVLRRGAISEEEIALVLGGDVA
jgi:L-threonylcarbamoyladenylate synthase